MSDDSGAVRFTTIYPGWYSGRAVHIHVRIRTYSGTTILDNFTLQIFFDDTVTDQVFVSAAPYNQRRARDTRNANDMVLTGTRNGSVVYAELTGNADNSYSALATIGLNVKAAVAAKPVISAAGVVNAGGFQPGLTPGAWTTIFGQNRAAASQSLASSDIAGGALPSALGGVTVRMGSEAAFVDFVSPTRINVQAPASVGNGAVAVTVSTAGGTSDAVTVPGQPILPALFAFQGYAAGTSSAKLGAVVELYGTGFGTTDPAFLPGHRISGLRSSYESCGSYHRGRHCRSQLRRAGLNGTLPVECHHSFSH